MRRLHQHRVGILILSSVIFLFCVIQFSTFTQTCTADELAGVSCTRVLLRVQPVKENPSLKQHAPQVTDHRRKSSLRVLLFITTHLSPQHLRAFTQCWPRARQTAPQLHRNSDVMIFSTGGATNAVPFNVTSLWSSPQSVSVVLRDNPGYQEGANLPMLEASANKSLFDAYDWVVRLNPDVIIRNETRLLALMHDPDAEGIFADCWARKCERNCTGNLLNTDFFALRPHALPDRTSWPKILNAEEAFTKAMESTMKKGKDRWLLYQKKNRGGCRTQGDVEHNHGFVEDCMWLNANPSSPREKNPRIVWCQNMSDTFGTNGHTLNWGTAPNDVRSLWLKNGCNTAPRRKRKRI